MRLLLSKEEKYTCITVEGRLDTLTAADFDAEMAKVLEKETHLVINFSKCSYLSSNGIRSLIILTKKLTAKSMGRLVLAALPAEVKHVIEMAGLHQVFTIVDGVEDGAGLLQQMQEASLRHGEISYGKWSFDYQPVEKQGQTAMIWQNQDIAGYDELGISAGIGKPAEAAGSAEYDESLFFTTGNCAVFFPLDRSAAPDFRISTEPSQAGVLVKEACSFHRGADAFFELKEAGPITWKEMLTAIHGLAQKIIKDKVITGFVVASEYKEWTGITTGFIIETASVKHADGQPLRFVKTNKNTSDIPAFACISLKLDKLHKSNDVNILGKLLNANISFENITDLVPIDLEEGLINPRVWLFIGNKTADAAKKRISIAAPDEFLAEPYKAFLARRLYRDSSRLELKPLQGGFSAQTFHVTSWDAAGRKLRPTVLKIADRDMITREAKHCKDYAMPYILNNSAMILGAEYFGDSGALRYNFVGIGGEESRLKWLTNYFLEWPLDRLEPLFDKIFLKILKPWYGQAVKQTIYPYRDHDPTKTFFPDIFQKAEALFDLSADDKTVWIRELDKNMLNPYWVLKHHYRKMENKPVEFPTSICHGDLNMQNILLDEQMNVYLIDFSETRTRSVVSDFARFEAIFIMEFMPVNTEADLRHIMDILLRFYANADFEARNFPIDDLSEEVRRNLHMSKLMRRYAVHHADGDTLVSSYFLAMLEWVLPVICYRQVTPLQKRLSFILASLLYEKLGI